jgi:hypothetical protein
MKYNSDIVGTQKIRMPDKDRHEKENKDHSYILIF